MAFCDPKCCVSHMSYIADTYLNIRKSWSISESPWKSGLLVPISAKMHPILQISTGVEYLADPSNTSGARYHRVTTYQTLYRYVKNTITTPIYLSDYWWFYTSFILKYWCQIDSIFYKLVTLQCTHLMSVDSDWNAKSSGKTKVSQLDDTFTVNEQILRL